MQLILYATNEQTWHLTLIDQQKNIWKIHNTKKSILYTIEFICNKSINLKSKQGNTWEIHNMKRMHNWQMGSKIFVVDKIQALASQSAKGTHDMCPNTHIKPWLQNMKNP